MATVEAPVLTARTLNRTPQRLKPAGAGTRAIDTH